MEQIAVKRHITAWQWNRIRVAFRRTVEYGHLAQKDKSQIQYHHAAYAVLLESLDPLSKQERKLVRGALNSVTIIDDLEAAADRLLMDDLRISL